MNNKVNPDFWAGLERKQEALFELRVTPSKLKHIIDFARGYKYLRIEPIFKKDIHREEGLLLKTLEPEKLTYNQMIEKSTVNGPVSIWMPYSIKPNREVVVDLEVIGDLYDRWNPYLEIIKDVAADDLQDPEDRKDEAQAYWYIVGYKSGHYKVGISITSLLGSCHINWSVDSKGQVWLLNMNVQGSYQKSGPEGDKHKTLFEAVRIKYNVMKYVNDALEKEKQNSLELRKADFEFGAKFGTLHFNARGPIEIYFTDDHLYKLMPLTSRRTIQKVLNVLAGADENATGFIDYCPDRPIVITACHQEGEAQKRTYRVLRPIKEEDFKSSVFTPALNYPVIGELASLAADVAEEMEIGEEDNALPYYLALKEGEAIFSSFKLQEAISEVFKELVGSPVTGLPLDITSWEIQDRIFTKRGLRYPLEMIYEELEILHQKRIITYVSEAPTPERLVPIHYLFVRAPRVDDFERLAPNLEVFYEPQKEGEIIKAYPKPVVRGIGLLPRSRCLPHVHPITPSPAWDSGEANPKLDLLLMNLDLSLARYKAPEPIGPEFVKAQVIRPPGPQVIPPYLGDDRQPCPFEHCKFISLFPGDMMRDRCVFKCPEPKVPDISIKGAKVLIGGEGPFNAVSIYGTEDGLFFNLEMDIEFNRILDKLPYKMAMGEPVLYRSETATERDDRESLNRDRQRETVKAIKSVYVGLLYRTWIRTYLSGRKEVVVELEMGERVRYVVGRSGLIISGGIRYGRGEEIAQIEE